MMASMTDDRAERPTMIHRVRGFAWTYRPGERQACPGCGSYGWDVGRFSAECMACGAVMEIATGGRRQMMGKAPGDA